MNAVPPTSVSASTGVQVGSGNTQIVAAAPVPSPADVPAPSGVDNLPMSSAVFVGRDVGALAELLRGSGGAVVGQAAVHGLGGIGKTELAVHYAREFRGEYGLVWWITADTPQNLDLGLAALTRRLHPVAMLADARAWAIGWLQAHTGWLLVLDNVEDVAHIRPLLGQVTGRGRVLITTRRDVGAARWAGLGLAELRLGVLDRAASVELLGRLTGLADPAGADRLAADLGDLPLALEQAAAYISQHPEQDFDGYRRLLADRFARIAATAGEGGRAERTVASIWQVTMDAILARSPLAGRVLSVLAWLAPEALPEDVLGPLAEDSVDLADALALLASYNMASRASRMVSVHRLVQAVVRAAHDDDARRLADGTAGGEAVRMLLAAIPEDPIINVAGWPRWAALLPHIDALLDHAAADHENTALMYLGDRAATYRQFQGQVAPAVDLLERVVADYQRVLGEDVPYTMATQHNLAGAYASAGHHDKAIDLLERLVTKDLRLLGSDHPTALMSLDALAEAYRSVGRLAEAIALFERVRAAYQRVLGDHHPDTLISQNNLAVAYCTAGRIDEAIDLHEDALAARRRTLGTDHPSTLSSRHNLAFAYKEAGRVTEAISLWESVLADQRRVLGHDHPSTRTTEAMLRQARETP